jgi:hypothetical protein
MRSACRTCSSPTIIRTAAETGMTWPSGSCGRKTDGLGGGSPSAALRGCRAGRDNDAARASRRLARFGRGRSAPRESRREVRPPKTNAVAIGHGVILPQRPAIGRGAARYGRIAVALEPVLIPTAPNSRASADTVADVLTKKGW